ncbi:MAG: MaoC family dehydratase [Candidatus Competibacteraceae bacterium]|nr:MaoC family dehydratase [Candidatus Competibacteraceae bacterium]
MSASYAKTVTETDVVMFAGFTGDNNPMHCNEVFAAQTQFKSRIAHGMFCAGLISCVAGTRLPGPGAVYVDQQLRFKAPVRIGDTVTALCTIQEIIPERRRVIMKTICTVGDAVVVEGAATFMVERRPRQ